MSPSTTRIVPFGISLGMIARYAVLLIGLSVTLLPFVYVLVSSLKTPAEIIRVPPSFFPKDATLQNYLTIFADPRVPVATFFANSTLVAVGRVLITLFTSSLAGYIFARYEFSGKNLMFGVLMAQIMIPFQMIMIPLYLILVQLQLIDTLWGLILPAMIDAFGIFLMRQFIEGIPRELIDAGRMDGASEFQIYARLILPQLRAPLASLGIFTFMATWNDYLWPLIVITTHEKRTLPLLLTWYSNAHGSRPALTMAASVIVLLPIVLIYILFQRQIVANAATTGFK
ncbi:MAG: carbohydrate ABC transporter permease [Roseiflexaceae bacterium]|jgi:multiple sugar transport system permease protein